MPFNPEYNDNTVQKRAEAIAAGHTRLLAFAYYADPSPECLDWKSFPNEAAMTEFIESWDRAESMSLNCAVAIAAVNPNDSEESIKAILAQRFVHKDEGPGYFSSAF